MRFITTRHHYYVRRWALSKHTLKAYNKALIEKKAMKRHCKATKHTFKHLLLVRKH